jgi:hypothetical protein
MLWILNLLKGTGLQTNIIYLNPITNMILKLIHLKIQKPSLLIIYKVLKLMLFV